MAAGRQEVIHFSIGSELSVDAEDKLIDSTCHCRLSPDNVEAVVIATATAATAAAD